MTTEITTSIRTALPIAQLLPMVLNIQNVSKQYNKKNWGLRDFSLEIGPGVFGLLGPKGYVLLSVHILHQFYSF